MAPRRTFLPVLITVVFLHFGVPLLFAQSSLSPASLTPTELIELKKLGFTEADVKAEVTRSRRSYEVSAQELQTLRAAGFSDDFLAFLQTLRPRQRLTNDDIVTLVKQQRSPEEILQEMRRAERAFDASPPVLLTLFRDHQVPAVVLRAMQGRPLAYEALQDLASKGVSGHQLLLLLDIVGFEGVELSPAQALELVRAGVPSDVVARLRDLPHSATAPGAGDLPQPGYYPHPLGLFTLRYPKSWSLVREIQHGNVVYAVTPETGKTRLDDVTIAFELLLLGMKKDALISGMSPAQALTQLLPLFLKEEPGLQATGSATAAKLGNLPAARLSLTGTLLKKPGDFRGDVYLGVKDHFVFMAITAAPEAQFAQLSGTFDTIVQQATFLPDPIQATRDKRYPAEEIAAKYKDALVSIGAFRDGQPLGTGSGFLIREDGYILTNHHVIWDTEKDQPATSFAVEWDADLKLPPQEATLIAYKRTTSPFWFFNWGIDLALLKIPADRPYNTMPLTPLGQVRLGEPVLTMGFPARGLIPTLSTIVTSGIVTRFNKDAQGKTESIYIDAPIAHGSSGGPSLSLITAGVVGLNTFGVDAKAVEKIPVHGIENLVNYFGVVPIDFALQEFPLEARVSAAREKQLDAIDYYDLALRSADLGSASGAVRMAAAAVRKAEDSADAYALLGMLQVVSAPDAKARQTGFQTLQRALRLDAKHLNTLLFLAESNRELGEAVEAMQYANRAVEAALEDWQGYQARGKIHLAIQRYDDALKDLQQAKTFTRGVLPDPYVLAGEVFYTMGRFQEGKQEYLQALQIHPANLEARMGVARFSMLTENYITALLEYDKLNKEYPGTPPVLAAMGRAQHKLKKFDKAIGHYLDAIEKWHQLGLTPPEDAYLEAAPIASPALRKPEQAIQLYAQYLQHYFQVERAFDAHLHLANLLKPRLSPAIAKGHLIHGRLMRQDDAKVQQELQALGNVVMSKDDIKLMLKLRYPELVAARVVAVSPLNFAVRSREDLQALLKEFPEAIVVGILEAQKAYMQGQAQQGGAPQAGAVPAELVGTWLGQVATQAGANGQIQLALSGNGQYQFLATIGGQQAQDWGTFALGANSLILSSAQTRQQFALQVRLAGSQLIITDPQFGEVAYARMR